MSDLYGGQAVIEGVMMRGPHHFAVAARRANGEIALTCEPVPKILRPAWQNSLLFALNMIHQLLRTELISETLSIFVLLKNTYGNRQHKISGNYSTL